MFRLKFSNTNLNKPLHAKGPGHVQAWGCQASSHRTMQLCLSVVWQCGACILATKLLREWSTPGRPLCDQILGNSLYLGYPMGDRILGDPPTPGPPLGDHSLGPPPPLGQSWATKSQGIPYPWASPGRPHPRGHPTPGPPLGDRTLGNPHPWATPGRPNPMAPPTPGPPLGDHILGHALPLGYLWATTC